MLSEVMCLLLYHVSPIQWSVSSVSIPSSLGPKLEVI